MDDDMTQLLAKVPYPTGRDALLAAAHDDDAPTTVIARLEALDGDKEYATVEAVERALSKRRAESNPALVSVVAEVCETCGFMKVPGEPHSCIEEKAQFADAVQAITDEFESIDDSTSRPPDPDAA
jgi:hypothetical protein